MWPGAPGAGMNDHAVAERRQRNREHAKRSRVRKKFMLESLQEQVAALQLENQRLRTLVQDNIPEHAQKIISECCQSNSLFADSKDDDGKGGSKPQPLVRSDFQLMASLSTGQQNFVLSDPRLPDNPIVFATPGFYKLTGYTQEQVLGRNCRFLQGPGTNPKSVDIIRKAIATGADCTVCILNYKADGTPFWNQFFVAALRDADNCIVNYVRICFDIRDLYGSQRGNILLIHLFVIFFRWVSKQKSNPTMVPMLWRIVSTLYFPFRIRTTKMRAMTMTTEERDRNIRAKDDVQQAHITDNPLFILALSVFTILPTRPWHLNFL
jgi:PAS domain S-box-containing protein